MKKILLFILLFSVVLLITSCKKENDLNVNQDFSIKDSLPLGNGEKVSVVLLYGQSNATGCSHKEYLLQKDKDTYDKANKGIDNVFINYVCENGSNSSNGEFVLCTLGQGASINNFGPEVGIALLNIVGVDLFLIING